MKRKEKPLSFGEWREAQELKRSVNECSWTALILGSALAFSMALRSDCTTGVQSKIFLLLSVSGVVLVLIGGFCPLVLRRPVRFLSKGINLIGKVMLRLLLCLLYLLFLMLSLPAILKRRGSEHIFSQWNDDRSGLPDTAFLPFQKQTVHPQSTAAMHAFNSLFHTLARHKLLYLLPLVVIMLILGLVFFFISAHSVFSFVYALF